MSTPSRNPSVKLVNGQVTTTSIKVAEFFGKRHCDVLRAIKNLECPEEYRLRNFVKMAIERKNPSGGSPLKSMMYTITRDGFSLLGMGFTGKEAVQWKIAYLEAFNALEKSLLDKLAAKRLPKSAAAKALPAQTDRLAVARYHYPRNLLNQAYFTNRETGAATLDLMMMTSPKFISPLLSLLNQLRSDGHDVTAPLDEALAMRAALLQSDQALRDITSISLRAQAKSAEVKH